MSMLTAIPPWLAVFIVACLLPLFSRWLGHAIGIGTLAGVTLWVITVPTGMHLPVQFLGFDAILFNVDGFSRLMGIIFSFIGTMAVIYSYGSNAENLQTAFAMSYVGTSLGAVFAGDWLSLIFFWELMAITSTLLVWHYGDTAVRAGFRYALLHGISGSVFMAAIVWHYAEVGSFLFSATEGISPGLPAVLAAVGIGVNVGFVGLHAWLPDTYPRPHIAASVFLCVYTTKTGVYGMYRAFPEGNIWVAYMGGAMAVVGAGYALLQNDMRRLLSYHIQSQVGYMIAGVGIGTALATAGAFAHIFNHILYKSLLFMTVGVVIYRTGEEKLKNVGGLAREMPFTTLSFTIAALSIAGFPGFNGFVSKGMVITAAEEEHIEALWWLLLAGGVGTFLSFIKLGYYVFFHGERSHRTPSANFSQIIAMFSVATLCVLYGVYPDVLFTLLPGHGAEEAHPFTVGHIREGLTLGAIGLVGFFVIKTPLSRIGRVPDIDAIYNPIVFYGMRRVVYGITKSYFAVDRGVVWLVDSIRTLIYHPRVTLGRIFTLLPNSLTGKDYQQNEDSTMAVPVRATFGTNVLIIILFLTIVLVLLLS